MNRELKSIFDGLYDRHKSEVFRYLCYLTRDRSLSEDLFQETWLRVVKHLDRLERIQEARAALEAEAREQAEANKRAEKPKLGGRHRKKKGGRFSGVGPAEPKHKAQRNFTDPDSPIMMGRHTTILLSNEMGPGK